MNTSHARNHQWANVPGLLRFVTAGICLCFYAAAIWSLWRLQLLPAKLLLAGVIAGGLVLLALLYILLGRWPRRFLSRALACLVAVVFMAGSGYTAILGQAANRFLSSSRPTAQTTVSYSLVTARMQSAKQFQTVGYLADETLADRAATALGLGGTVQRSSVSDLGTLLIQTADSTTPAAMVRTAQLDVVKDNNTELYAQLKTVKTAMVRVAAAQQSKLKMGEPFVLYISGIDTYGDISTVSRSDVNILAVVNPRAHRILLVNTPRDYYVQLHGTTGLRDKLTHAGIYGIDMSRQTLQDLYGVQISQYMRINFTSLTRTIDALGGVDVQSAYDFSVGKYHFTQGTNHLDSAAALAFARERHAFDGGDRVRGQNQQRVIEAIITKLNNPRNLLHFQQVLGSLEGALQTSISTSDQKALIRDQLGSMQPWSVSSISVDGTGDSQPTYSMGSQLLYVMIPDQSSLDTARHLIREGLGND